MGVSLDYSSVEPITTAQFQEILSLVDKKCRSRRWWSEGINVLHMDGHVRGWTKPCRVINDQEVDWYMAYLDICEIVQFFTEVSQALGIDWRFEMEGGSLGMILYGAPDDELEQSLSSFFESMPWDFERLKEKTRAEILDEWDDE